MKNATWIAGVFLRKNILVERTVALWLLLENLNSNIAVRWNSTVQTSSSRRWNLALRKWLHYSSVSYSLNKSSFVAQPRMWTDKCLTPFALKLEMLPKPSHQFKNLSGTILKGLNIRFIHIQCPWTANYTNNYFSWDNLISNFFMVTQLESSIFQKPRCYMTYWHRFN